jgi:hypothetical protein
MMSMSREQFLATSGAEVHRLEFWLEQRWLIPQAADAGFTDREVAADSGSRSGVRRQR